MSDDRPPPFPPPTPPTVAPRPPPTARHQRRWVVPVAALAVVAAAVTAAVVTRSGGDEGTSGDYGLLHQDGVQSTTFVLSRPDGDEIRRLTLSYGGDDEAPPRLSPVGRGHVVVTGEASTLIVPLDGGEPIEIAEQRLFPASDWLTDPHQALDGVILGEPPGGSIVVDFETGSVRELGDLIDGDGPYFVVGYTDDGRYALVESSDDTWLVPLAGDAEARALDGRAGDRSLKGDRIAVMRGRGDATYQLVLTSLDDTSEEELWSGDGPRSATWSGDKIAVVGAEGVTLVEPDSGDAAEILDGVELEPSAVGRTFGHLVSTRGDELRWYRLDDEGAEVTELRGLDTLDVNAGGARVLFGQAGDSPRVMAWDPQTGSVQEVEGTDAQLEVLAEGARNNVMSSPGGRFVTGGFAPVLLADFDTGDIVEFDDEVSFAGGFSPDDEYMLVSRVESGGLSLTIVDPTDPLIELVELGDEPGSSSWVVP